MRQLAGAAHAAFAERNGAVSMDSEASTSAAPAAAAAVSAVLVALAVLAGVAAMCMKKGGQAAKPKRNPSRKASYHDAPVEGIEPPSNTAGGGYVPPGPAHPPSADAVAVPPVPPAHDPVFDGLDEQASLPVVRRCLVLHDAL